MSTPSRLARYVTPKLYEERVVAQWTGSLAVARLRGREQRARLALGVAALCLVAAVLVRPWSLGSSPRATAGTTIESGLTETQRLTLPDATAVELGAATRVSLVEVGSRRVRLRLERGRVALNVTRHPERELSVEVGDVDVIVVGTAFSVEVGDAPGEPKISVAVERGEVRVVTRSTGAETRLGPGQSFTDAPIGPSAALATPPPSSAPPFAVALPSSAASGAPPPIASGRDWRSLRRTDPRAAFDALGTSGFAQAVAGGSAADLFELYEVAQLAGRPREAASALAQLGRRYPGDARAGLAAFELGRLRQDQLGDPAGAVAALQEALRRGGPFGEDATARLVRAHQALGNRAACERARRDYLARYPRGVHADAVRRLCGR